jgi:hypothetical protein
LTTNITSENNLLSSNIILNKRKTITHKQWSALTPYFVDLHNEHEISEIAPLLAHLSTVSGGGRSTNSKHQLLAPASIDSGSDFRRRPGPELQRRSHLLALLDEVPSDGHCFVVEAGPQKIGFAIDSALEGDGFELPVPREMTTIFEPSCFWFL